MLRTEATGRRKCSTSVRRTHQRNVEIYQLPVTRESDQLEVVVEEMSRRLSVTDRRDAVARLVIVNGTISVAQLADILSVSVMTIHRDLNDLAADGAIRRVRGGASAEPSAVFESSARFRLTRQAPAKGAIARAALTHIKPGMSLMLDASTTALTLARLLDLIGPTTVITNFLETIKVVSQSRDTRLVCLGGQYDRNYDAFIGVQCLTAIHSMRADLAFISISAVSGGMAYHQEAQMVQLAQAMVQSSERVILLVDSTKLGRVALHTVFPLSEADLLITDNEASLAQIRDLERHDVRFEVVPVVPRSDETLNG